MYGKMQESGLTEIIPFICISAIWGQYPVLFDILSFLTIGSDWGLMAATYQVFFLSAFRAHQLTFSHFSSVQSLRHARLCNPMDCSTPGLPVHHQLLEFTQTHVHWVCDAIQPSHPLSSSSPPTFGIGGLHSYCWWLWYPCLLIWQE